MAQATDIVGYTYNADQYGPECIIEAFGRFSNVGDPTQDIEYRLDYIAHEMGIDREDESSFDSDDFPKAIFRDQLSDRPGDGTEPNRCGNCGKELGEN